MWKSELRNSGASRDKNNVIEESETSEDEYLSDFTKLQLYRYDNPVFQKSMIKNYPGKESTNSDVDAELEILSGVLVLNTNQWLLVQEAFAAWINMKFVKDISKVYFHSFLKYFYPIIY